MATQATQAYYNPIMEEYFHKKFGWDTATFHNIVLDASEKEYHRLSPGRQLASFKLQNGLWPTNKILHQHKKIPSPLFPPVHTTPRDSQPCTPLQTCATNKASAMEQGNNSTNSHPQDSNPTPRCTRVWDSLMAGRRHRYPLALPIPIRVRPN